MGAHVSHSPGAQCSLNAALGMPNLGTFITWVLNSFGHRKAMIDCFEISTEKPFSVKMSSTYKHYLAGADLVNWGPQANIGMGPYTFAHIYLDQPWGFFFCRDACCCTVVPHSWVQCFYIFHVRYNGILSFTFTFIHLADAFILSCCRPRNSNWLTVEIQVLTKKRNKL